MMFHGDGVSYFERKLLTTDPGSSQHLYRIDAPMSLAAIGADRPNPQSQSRVIDKKFAARTPYRPFISTPESEPRQNSACHVVSPEIRASSRICHQRQSIAIGGETDFPVCRRGREQRLQFS